MGGLTPKTPLPVPLTGFELRVWCLRVELRVWVFIHYSICHNLPNTFYFLYVFFHGSSGAWSYEGFAHRKILDKINLNKFFVSKTFLLVFPRKWHNKNNKIIK